MAEGRRKPLGRRSGLFQREKVFLIAEGLEIDDVDFATIRRTRVFFEDIHSIALHRHHKSWRSIIALLLALPFLISGLLTDGEPRGVLLLMSTPFIVISAILLINGIDVVTVRGLRTKAVMEFIFMKGRARRVFERIASLTRRAQHLPPPGLAGRTAGEERPETTPQP
ncbi:MAG: hypothetical protein KY459_13105 [Acidobacteria bacterium]|nr:hypothetical protein [Acidobacteriota bacterium]